MTVGPDEKPVVRINKRTRVRHFTGAFHRARQTGAHSSQDLHRSHTARTVGVLHPRASLRARLSRFRRVVCSASAFPGHPSSSEIGARWRWLIGAAHESVLEELALVLEPEPGSGTDLPSPRTQGELLVALVSQVVRSVAPLQRQQLQLDLSPPS